MKEFITPREVGDKIEISGLSVDQFLIVSGGAALGIVTWGMLYGLILGIVGSIVYGRVARRYPDGFLLHVSYWFSVPVLGTGNKALPPAEKKEFHE